MASWQRIAERAEAKIEELEQALIKEQEKQRILEVVISELTLTFFLKDFSAYGRYDLALPEDYATRSIIYCLEDFEAIKDDEISAFYTLLRENTNLNEEKLKPYAYLCLYTS
jgi:uncharacterized ubiquitin-like protein YukD